MNTKKILVIFAALLTAGAIITLPALATNGNQLFQADQEVDSVTITGIVLEISNKSFIVDTGDEQIIVVIPGPYYEVQETLQNLGLEIGDTVTVEGTLADSSSGLHHGYCGEVTPVEGEHFMAFKINGMEVFSPDDLGYHHLGSQGQGHQGRQGQQGYHHGSYNCGGGD
ncbi:MAG: hypothetical protein ACFFD4_10255 [Candidatus Odinarchaeota archaeon]